MQQMIPVKLKKLVSTAKDLKRGTPGAAGWDVAYAGERPVTIYPGHVHKLRTGYAFELPNHIAVMVLPKSGRAVNDKIRPANTPGLIDPDYRGELIVALENFSPFMQEAVEIQPGEYIAQIVFVPFFVPMLQVTTELDNTVRGEGGFGSTGIK